jgi:hypothetical protein
VGCDLRRSLRLTFPALLLSAYLAPARAVHAQTTFFQVPSADVPSRGQTHAQFQLAAGEIVDVGAAAMVGLGGDWELGVTLYNLEFAARAGRVALDSNAREASEPYAPLALASAQKLFELGERFGLAFGAQLGSNLARAGLLSAVARGYALFVLDLGERGRCTLGPYAATRNLLGDRHVFGGFAGCEIELVIDRLAVEADWDAGQHALGALSLGPRVHLGEHAALTVGLQIPNAWGSADYRYLMQLEFAYPGHEN